MVMAGGKNFSSFEVYPMLRLIKPTLPYQMALQSQKNFIHHGLELSASSFRLIFPLFILFFFIQHVLHLSESTVHFDNFNRKNVMRGTSVKPDRLQPIKRLTASSTFELVSHFVLRRGYLRPFSPTVSNNVKRFEQYSQYLLIL